MPETAIAPAPAPSAPAPAASPAAEAPATPSAVPAPPRPEPRVVNLKDFLARSDKSVTKVTGRPVEPKPAVKEPAKKPAAGPAKDPVTGKFTSSTPKPVEPQASTPEPPAGEQPPEPAKPAAPAKIKIGDEEKTAEEWNAHYKALKEAAEAKAKAPETPAAPAKPEIEMPTKTDAELDQEFIDSYANEIGLTDEEFDQALASGNPAPIRAKIAKAALDTRKWAAEHLTNLKKELEAMRPAIEMAEKVKQHEAEQAFNQSFPDIAKHPEGAKVRAEVKAALAEHATFLEWKKQQGKAAPEDEAFLKLHTEDPNQLIGWNTRKRLGLPTDGTAHQPATEPPAATPQPAPVAQRPPAPTGQRPGAAATPQAISPVKSLQERLRRIH